MYHTRSKNMLSGEVKEYFEELVRPLVTNTYLEELFEKFKNEVVLPFEKKINEQEKRITHLESTLAISQNTVDVLLGKLEEIEVRTDDNEQYSRRSCLRIHGVYFDEKTRGENIDEILSDCFQKVDVPFDRNEIDRAHRIGSIVVDRETGKSSRQIIVKFKSWIPRCDFFKARPKAFQNGKKKPASNQLPFRVSLDLSKRRHDLLKRAKEIIKDNVRIKYAFSDINCSLGMKTTDDRFLYFNTFEELNDIIEKISI